MNNTERGKYYQAYNYIQIKWTMTPGEVKAMFGSSLLAFVS